jgi:hypothetical protein
LHRLLVALSHKSPPDDLIQITFSRLPGGKIPITANIDYRCRYRGVNQNFWGLTIIFFAIFPQVTALLIDGRPAAIHGFSCAWFYILVVSIPGIAHALRTARHDYSNTHANTCAIA